MKRHKSSQENAQGQARKGTRRAATKRHKGRHRTTQMQERNGTKVGKERYESRQGKVQRQLRKGKAGKGQLRIGTKQVERYTSRQ